VSTPAAKALLGSMHPGVLAGLLYAGHASPASALSALQAPRSLLLAPFNGLL
jgi:hypothetical protein